MNTLIIVAILKIIGTFQKPWEISFWIGHDGRVYASKLMKPCAKEDFAAFCPEPWKVVQGWKEVQ